MAKCGNHGIIIPRDKELLTRLYWDDGMTLPEMGAMFGVTHKSVERVMRELDIPRRRIGPRERSKCIECAKPPMKIKHPINGALYGKRCLDHQRAHKASLSRKSRQNPNVSARRKWLMRRWYYFGPLNPEGEKSWLTKSLAMLRTAKRHLSGKESPEASELANVALKRGQSLPT